jgi:hypothetical protein
MDVLSLFLTLNKKKNITSLKMMGQYIRLLRNHGDESSMKGHNVHGAGSKKNQWDEPSMGCTVEQGKIGHVIILKSKLKLYLGLFHVVLE